MPELNPSRAHRADRAAAPYILSMLTPPPRAIRAPRPLTAFIQFAFAGSPMKTLAALALLLTSGAAVSADGLAARPRPRDARILDARRIDPARVLVRFDPAATPAERAELCKLAGSTQTAWSSTLVPGLTCIVVAPGAVIPAVDSLRRSASVLYAEPSFAARIFEQTPSYGVGIVNPQPVWPATKGSGARLAVLDTGLDLAHPDLPTPVAIASFIPGETANDGNGHGTHCAGIALARDNDIGVVGICPECDILVAKAATNAGGGTYEQIIAAIEWSVANNAHVISMSIGGPDFSQALMDACDAATAADVLCVAAAGNTPDASPNYPAAYESVVSVMAVDENKNRAFFSSLGPTIDIGAPGLEVISTTATFRERCTVLGSETFCAQLSNSSTGIAVTAPAIFCGTGGEPADFPPAVVGAIAHIRRGGSHLDASPISVTEKCFNALVAGAAGCIISNNAPGPFDEDLLAIIDIPCIAVSGSTGDALEPASGSLATIDLTQNASTYLPLSGTSMSCPHVAAVAALMVALYGPDRLHVPMLRQALLLSAEDRGAPGRDDLYGYGIVRADLAKAYLDTQLPPLCPADFNADGELNPDDLADYIGAFFAQPPGQGSDFNADAEVNPDDLADFIGAYFAGCA